MIVLSLKHLSLSFAGEAVIKDASFSLNEGDRAAILGKNGAGKSTLLKLVSGEYTPEKGEAFLAGGKTVGVLDQHALTDSEKNVLDEALGAHAALLETEEELHRLQKKVEAGEIEAANRYARLSEEFERAGGLTYLSRTKSALDAVGLGEMAGRKVSTLSGGQKTTLALVKLLLSPPDLLLLDEPTNHLDIHALAWLEETVRNLKCTLLCVSHDRWFLERTMTQIIDLEGGRTEVYRCSYTRYREEKRARRAAEKKHYDLQQKEIRRQEEIIRTFKQFNREKSIRAAESRQKALDRIERLDRPADEQEAPSFSFHSRPSPREILRIHGLSFSYGATPIIGAFDAEIDRGERIFLIGPVGSGKSTLLKLLAGRLPLAKGAIRRGPGLSEGYYDQENQDLRFSGTVFDEIWSLAGEDSQGEVRSYLAAFGFGGERAFQTVSTLSGGERARLSLAKLMRGEHNLLFLDEPTNHLDMDSKEALEEALAAYPGTCVIVSHDRWFIQKLATRVYFLRRGESPVYLERGVENLEDLFRGEKAAAPVSKPVGGKQDYLRRKADAAEARRRQNAKKQTEAAIAETERQLDALSEEIARHENDYQKLQVFYEEKERTEARLETLYETLFSLEDKA